MKSQTIRISGALVFLCTSATIPLKNPSKSPIIPRKTPQNRRLFVCPLAKMRQEDQQANYPQKNVRLALSIRAFKPT